MYLAVNICIHSGIEYMCVLAGWGGGWGVVLHFLLCLTALSLYYLWPALKNSFNGCPGTHVIISWMECMDVAWGVHICGLPVCPVL